MRALLRGNPYLGRVLTVGRVYASRVMGRWLGVADGHVGVCYMHVRYIHVCMTHAHLQHPVHAAGAGRCCMRPTGLRLSNCVAQALPGVLAAQQLPATPRAGGGSPSQFSATQPWLQVSQRILQKLRAYEKPGKCITLTGALHPPGGMRRPQAASRRQCSSAALRNP